MVMIEVGLGNQTDKLNQDLEILSVGDLSHHLNHHHQSRWFEFPPHLESNQEYILIR